MMKLTKGNEEAKDCGDEGCEPEVVVKSRQNIHIHHKTPRRATADQDQGYGASATPWLPWVMTRYDVVDVKHTLCL